MPTCFIIMLMTTPQHLRETYSGGEKHFAHALKTIFEPAVEDAGFEPRAPAAEGSDVIHAHIIEQLATADLVLCDMSTLNPNVFFELGIRTAINKPACIVKDDHTPEVPFDTGLINHHTYLSALNAWDTDEERARLSAHLKKSAEKIDEGNSLWKYFRIDAQAHWDASEPSSDDKLDHIVRQLDALSMASRPEPPSIFQVADGPPPEPPIDLGGQGVANRRDNEEVRQLVAGLPVNIVQLSKRLGIDHRTVYSWLHGRANFSPRRLHHIREALERFDPPPKRSSDE